MAHKTTTETVTYRQTVVTESSIKDTVLPYFDTTVAQLGPRTITVCKPSACWHPCWRLESLAVLLEGGSQMEAI